MRKNNVNNFSIQNTGAMPVFFDKIYITFISGIQTDILLNDCNSHSRQVIFA